AVCVLSPAPGTSSLPGLWNGREPSEFDPDRPSRSLGERQLGGAGGYLHEVALGIGKVAAVATPRGTIRRLDHLPTGAFGLGECCLDPLFRTHVVGEGDAPKASATRRNAGVMASASHGYSARADEPPAKMKQTQLKSSCWIGQPRPSL